MRIFSGIQPTGRKHLGNYIGAIRQWVEGQDRGDPAIYCIVDLHAITVAYDPAELRRAVYDTTAMLIAAGLDPSRCILFRQSDVKEHTELCWLLASVTAYGVTFGRTAASCRDPTQSRVGTDMRLPIGMAILSSLNRPVTMSGAGSIPTVPSAVTR